MDSGSWPWKLKTPIKAKLVSKVIMFEKTLELKAIIMLCYGNKKH